jgi:hypothetical protein
MAMSDSDMEFQPETDRHAVRISPELFVYGLTALVLAGALLRFDGLTDRDIWLDESCTFYAVHHLLDWPADGPDPQRELAHMPYFLLLHGWTRLLGETAWGMRSLSALAGTLTILAVGLVGAWLGGRRVGLISAALAAVHPLHVYYSQEARAYALWALEATICLYVLYRTARALRPRWWVVYGLLAWLIVLTHYYALLWLPATVAVILVAEDRRRCLRQWLLTHVLLGVSMIPLIWLAVLPHAETGPQVWLTEIWRGYPGILAVPRSLWALLPSGGYPSYLGTLDAVPQVVGGVAGIMASQAILWGPALVAVLLLAGGLLWSRSSEARVTDGDMEPHPLTGGPRDARAPIARTALYLLCVSFLFLLVALVHSLLAGPAYAVGRYDLIAWPSLIVAIALLIEEAARRWPRGTWQRPAIALGAACLLCGCGLTTSLAARSVPAGSEQAERADRIVSKVGEGDLVISLNLYRWFMAYEWHRMGFQPQVISFPPAHDRQMCWDDAPAELDNPGQIAADVAAVTGVIQQALADGRRVWLLAHGEPAGPRMAVDMHLYGRLRDLGIDIQPVEDETLGLAGLVP